MIAEFVPVDAVWGHAEPVRTMADVGPAVRVLASTDRPGDFVFQIREAGRVQSVRLSPHVVAELHRQAVRA